MKQRGMTLLELMVALAVFSLTAIAVLDIVGTTSRQVNAIEQKTIAHWVASNYLEQTRERSDWPNVGISRDKFEMAGREWFITIKVQATARQDIRRLTVEVAQQDDGDVLSSRDWFFGRMR